MPRSRGGASGRSAPARPTLAPPRPAPQKQQQRPASTAAHPPAPPQQQQQAAQSQSPGLFGQMASTAAGVAVGSSIGHAIGGMFGGSSSSTPAEQQQQPDGALQAQQSAEYQSNPYLQSCDSHAKAFTKCLDENKGEYQMSVCGWYLDQLKACQAAAKPY